MVADKVKLVSGFIATITLAAFIIGLADSISSGFAGFWGGLPFWIIIAIVLGMAIYDFWDECIRKNK